jgi:hypothetical protein
MKNILTCAALASALFSLDASADLKRDAAQRNLPCMVLCVGADWCVSGEQVRQTYVSDAFRRSLKRTWLFGIHDHWEGTPPPAVVEGNAAVQSLGASTTRYPALILYNSQGVSIGRVENIPFDFTAGQLADAVHACEEVLAKAEACFAAKRYGEGFSLLAGKIPGFVSRGRDGQLRVPLYRDEWNAMLTADPHDRDGWRLRLTMGDGMAEVFKGTSLAGKTAEGEAFVAELRKRPQAHLTVEQKQAIGMAEFAFIRRDSRQTERARRLLRAVYAAGPETLWGWAAQGFLTDRPFNEDVPPASVDRAAAVKFGRGIVDKPVRPPRKLTTAPARDVVTASLARRREILSAAFARGALAGEEEQDALSHVWALREIGTNTLFNVLSLDGGPDLVNRFLRDRGWIDDFFASGPIPETPAAFSNLLTLVRHDEKGAILAGGHCRRIATAIALNTSSRVPAEQIVRRYAAYAFLADIGRLHRSAYTNSVREWRFCIVAGIDAADLLFLNDLCNYNNDRYAAALNYMPYRLHSCFGESVHHPDRYYRPWRNCNWPGWAMRPRVGGVCGAASTIGSYCTRAHGLLSTTGRQPSHCAYPRRAQNGRWTINNYVWPYSTAGYCFWGNAFTYLDVVERSYADRAAQVKADRLLWMARLAEDDGARADAVEKWYRAALTACPAHYGVWFTYGHWLMRTKASDAKLSAFQQELAWTLPDGRQALWDLLNGCLHTIARRPGGKTRALDELVSLHARLPQPTGTPTREEMNFTGLLDHQVRFLSLTADEQMRLFCAVLTAQKGKPFFADVLRWGAGRFLSDRKTAAVFSKTVGDVGGESRSGIDYRRLMLSAAQSCDIAVFRSVADLFDRLNPVPAEAPRYPRKDFGGELVSGRGRLQISSTSRWDKPELYARALDTTRNPNPAEPTNPTTFHTNGERAPWALVELPGYARVTGIYLRNTAAPHDSRQLPAEILVSADGKTWITVATLEKTAPEYRIDVSPSVRARYVKVARVPGANNKPFSFAKILVYGTRLY